MIIDHNGKLFGRVNLFDFSVFLFLGLAALGILAVQSNWHQTSGQMVEGETDIQYTLHLRNVKTLHPETLFKPSETVSLTIRNQPRGEVVVLKSQFKPKQAIIPNGRGSFSVVPDPDDQHGYDFLVTLKDHAQVTADSYVTNGIKVKVGMQVIVENFHFRLPGAIADIEAIQTMDSTAKKTFDQ